MIKLDKDVDPNKIVRNLGKKYKLAPYLDKAFSDFEDEWEFKYQEKQHDHHWHPSSHCTEPVTVLYEIATGQAEREPLPASLRKIFQVGHFWHQLLQYVCLRKLEFCQEDDVERAGLIQWGDGPYHAAAGSADICSLVTPAWEGGVDFKTMNINQFKQSQISEFYAVKYECQLNIYMEMFEVDEWLILAINKDNGEFKEWVYARNQPLIDAILNKWKFVSLCLDTDTVPTAEDAKMFKLPEMIGPIAA